MMQKLLWLDDIRNPLDGNWLSFSPIQHPFECVWVKSYKEFVNWITENGLPDGICFDHDLGMEVALKARETGISKRQSRKLKQQEKTGHDCAKWLVEYCLDNNLKLPKWNVQSANPVGKDNINGILLSFVKNVENQK
jgi:hypothetical protein